MELTVMGAAEASEALRDGHNRGQLRPRMFRFV